MNAHTSELQLGGLIATAILLLLALILLNRAASELYRSRSQRLKSEKTFERLSSILSSRGLDGNALEELRIGRRVSMSGPAQRSAPRPMSAKNSLKPSPRNEPMAVPGLQQRSRTRKSLH